MDFDYSEDQRYLREEARRFLSGSGSIAVARQILDDPVRSYDATLWSKIAEQGWLGTAIPENYGGLGLSHVELGAIAEEIGAALAPVPFGSTLYLFAEALLMAGTEAQKQALLPLVATGSLIGCGAIWEGSGDLMVDAIRAEVRDGRLTGTKLPVVDGLIADHAVVLARQDDKIGLYLADLHDAAVTRVALESVDGTGGIARLEFDGVPVERLGNSDEATLLSLLARAAVMFGFEQVGGADACLKRTTEYAKERQAFGAAIGRFQAVKHKLADMFVGNELARSHVFHGVWAVEDSPERLMAAAAAARIAASDAYWFASKEAVHLHGAIGFTWEQNSHLYYRRAHTLSLLLGSPDWWKERLFAELAERYDAAA